ncbi:pyocin knob domain-containing protein [Pectobacterium punjabense]|uniref:pyocin knob domain-containing protein n=1 Tax=Pectobacterium punjabense TaxID=2108399 RepID=UPI002407273B|nr:pyocin knob domain-containing protein [Pectobacterium punjabense]MDG0795643.1 pyocin knob domain-containing protein [Pectobacterium punjabense]
MPADADVAQYLRNVPSGLYAILPNASATNLPPAAVASGWVFQSIKFNTSPIFTVIAQQSATPGSIFRGVISPTGVSWYPMWDNANLTPAMMYADRGDLGTVDLDTLFGANYRGTWTQHLVANSSIANHYPVEGMGGSLEVIYNASNGVGTVQRYVTAAYNRIFIRYKSRNLPHDVWSNWIELWTASNLVKQSAPVANDGNVLVAGLAGGIGKSSSQLIPNGQLAASFRANGGWYSQLTQNTDVPDNGHILNLFTHPTGNYGAQLWINYKNDIPDFRYRVIDNNVVSAWHPIMLTDVAQVIPGAKTFTDKPTVSRVAPGTIFEKTDITAGTVGRFLAVDYEGTYFSFNRRQTAGLTTGQQTVRIPLPSGAGLFNTLVSGINAIADSSGFYKTASPVIHIYADGSFTTTDEAEGVNVERLSEGVYKITGCFGMHSDAAWCGSDGGVSNPKCRNGLELTWNDFEVDEDGSVIVRTYHRPHPDAISFARNKLNGYENGDPIDVPRGLFIQVRVNMPESEPVKPAVMSSNVYCNTVSPAG